MSEPRDMRVGKAGRRALVADDDPVMRSLLRSRLALIVDEVVEATEGLEAWQLLSTERFDVAIIDLMMPGLDGFGLIGCLRGNPGTRHLPIVVVTSMSDRDSIERALEVGASSFMTKPLAWATFNAHIGHLIRLAAVAESAETRLAVTLADVRSAREAMRRLSSDIGGVLDGLRKRSATSGGDEGAAAVGTHLTDVRVRLERIDRLLAGPAGSSAPGKLPATSRAPSAA